MYIKVITYLLLVMTLMSCSNDAINKDSSMVVNLAYDTACFDGFSGRWSAWSRGEGKEALVKSDINCIVDGISYFILRVRGEKIGAYNSQEIFNFTQKFFKRINLPKESIDDLLILKSWLIGGDKDQVSFEELTRVSWFLQSTQQDVQKLTPVAEKLFFKTTQTQLSDTMAIFIKQAISNISKEFKFLTSSSKAQVTYDEFENVINRLLESLDSKPFEKNELKPYWTMALVTAGQSISQKLSFNSESGLSELAFRAWYIALRFKYGVSDIGWRDINSYVHLESVVSEVLNFLKNIVKLQPQDKLTLKDFNLLIYEALQIVNFNFNASQTWVKNTTDLLFSRYFKSNEFSFNEIEQLNFEWEKIRIFYSETLILQGLAFTGSLVETRNFVALNDINKRVLDFAWPLLSNQNGYVLNSLEPSEVAADYGNLFWLNWQRALATNFLNIYTTEDIRRKNLTGVNIQELEKGYGDVFSVLNGIGYLGDDEDKAWFRIFNEANLFVPRAQADPYLSFEEGIDYFALLFSGISFSGEMFNLMNTSCKDLTKTCQLNWLRFDEHPIWKQFAPDFAKYLKNVDDAEWKNFSEGLEQMARGEETNQTFKRFELLKVAIAIQYIETFLRKYDLNKDLKIDFTETVFSFDKFSAALLSLPQIEGTEAEEDPTTLLSFYAFFLRRGRLPRKTLGQYIELFGWRKKVENCVLKSPTGRFEVVDPKGCEYEASRGNLMKILAFLSNSL